MREGGLLFSWFPTYSMVGMAHRIGDHFFILSIDNYRRLKEASKALGYAAFDLAIPAGDEKRAFTCSENELQDVIQSVGHKFPLGKALVNLIRQQWQPTSKSQKRKPKKLNSANITAPQCAEADQHAHRPGLTLALTTRQR